MYGWGLAGILGITMLGMNVWTDRQRDNLEAAIDGHIKVEAGLRAAAVVATQARQVCEGTNAANSFARAVAVANAERAGREVTNAGATADAEVRDIQSKIDEARKNAPQECYRINEQYPDSFTRSLRDASGM